MDHDSLSIYVASSQVRRLPIMDLHRSLFCAFLFNCPYSLTLVQSLMSSIHILRGLPCALLPFLDPSMMLTTIFSLGFLLYGQRMTIYVERSVLIDLIFLLLCQVLYLFVGNFIYPFN